MKSQKVVSGQDLLPVDHNDLVDDARAASALLPHQQTVLGLTLYVEPGVLTLAGTQIEFAGGNSPSFTAPAANPRIDLLTINTSGVLERTAGTENASPVAPATPAGKMVIAQIYNRVGQTTVRDESVSGQGYIYKDLRVFLADGYIQNATQIKDGVITAVKLAETYVETTGDESIAGVKTFTSRPILPASNPTTDNEAVRKAYVDGLLSSIPATKFFGVQTNTEANSSAQNFRNMASVGASINSSSPFIMVLGTSSGYSGGGTDPFAYRMVKDVATGQYYITHQKTSFSSGSYVQRRQTRTFVTVMGDYAYFTIVNDSDSSFRLRRCDLADLGNETTMTISGTAPTANTTYGNPIFNDGTNLYIASGTNTFRKYTVADTTATYVAATYAFGFQASSDWWCDGTNVYRLDTNEGYGTGNSHTLIKYLLADGSTISTTRFYGVGSVFSYSGGGTYGPNMRNMGIVPDSSTILSLVNLEVNFTYNSSTRNNMFFAKMTPFTKP